MVGRVVRGMVWLFLVGLVGGKVGGKETRTVDDSLRYDGRDGWRGGVGGGGREGGRDVGRYGRRDDGMVGGLDNWRVDERESGRDDGRDGW